MRPRTTSNAVMIGTAVACAAMLAAAILMSGGPAEAANGDPILLGFGNNSTTGTSVNSTDVVGFRGVTNSTSNTAAGLMGQGPTGVVGESGTGTGVRGETSDNTHSGVVGINSAGTNSGGSGVVGIANNNIGVSAISSNGTALAVSGVASFTRSSRATVPAGVKKVVVSNVVVNNGTMVLATVQQKGRAAVASAVPNPAADTFTIYLTRAATKPVTVAWFVLN